MSSKGRADEDMDVDAQAPEPDDRPLLAVECHTQVVRACSAPALQADCGGIAGELWLPDFKLERFEHA